MSTVEETLPYPAVTLPANFSFICDVAVKVKCLQDGAEFDDTVLSHRVVLQSASPLFQKLLADQNEKIAQIELDLRQCVNAIPAFKAMISFLYSGDIASQEAQPAEILSVARACQVASAEQKLLTQHIELSKEAGNPYLDLLLQLYMQPQLAALLPLAGIQPLQPSLSSLLPFGGLSSLSSLALPLSSDLLQQTVIDACKSGSPDSASNKSTDENRSSGSSPRTATPFDNLGDVIVPSSDKEGWCRNKKYIEKVPAGFMCTVCRKVYGRYNSVSYHVTIYHRNPPIKCDEPGCQFTTREARYIHFHKYYRHHIPLPDSIDLGSRKCPFCRHVSKSPAMLEKHIARHVPEKRAAATAATAAAAQDTPTQVPPTQNELKSEPADDKDSFACEKCTYKATSSSLLQQHVSFAHSSDVFTRLSCPLCVFSTASQSALTSHISSAHLGTAPSTDDTDVCVD